MKSNQKGFIIPILVIIIASLLAIGGLYFFTEMKKPSDSFPVQQKDSNNSDMVLSKLSDNDVYKKFIEDCSVKLSTNPSDKEIDQFLNNRTQCQKTLYSFNSSELLNLKRQLDATGDYIQNKDLVDDALSYRLTTEVETNKTTYANISNSLEKNSSNKEDKISTIRILGKTPSKPSLLQLLKILLDDNEDNEIKYAASEAVVAMTSGSNSSLEALSPLLEDSYLKMKDNFYKYGIAIAIANIGAPSGIQLLLKDAIVNGNESAPAHALLGTRNLNAIPVLAKGLRNQRSSDVELIVSGNTLAEMGSSEATKVIINWAKSTDVDNTTLIKNWILKIRDEGSFQVVSDSLASNVYFKNIEIKNAIQDAFSEYKNNHGIK